MMEAYWLAVAVLPTEDVPRCGLPAVPSAVLPAGDLHWQEEQVVVMTATAPPVEMDKAQAAVLAESGGAGVLRWCQAADLTALTETMARQWGLPQSLTVADAWPDQLPPLAPLAEAPLYGLRLTAGARRRALLAKEVVGEEESLLYRTMELTPQMAAEALQSAVEAGCPLALSPWLPAFSDLAGGGLCLFGKPYSLADGEVIVSELEALQGESAAFRRAFAGLLAQTDGRPGLADLALFMEETSVSAETAQQLYARAVDQGHLSESALALRLLGGQA